MLNKPQQKEDETKQDSEMQINQCLYKEFETVVTKAHESTIKDYEYVTGLDYQEEKVNIIKYTDKKKETEFVYITDLPITNKNIKETIIVIRRWKIENEGFNILRKCV